MKNIICPVSNEKVNENQPRITAFFVVSLFTAYLLSGFLPFVIFLAYDFLVRGFNQSQYSLIAAIAKPLSSRFFSNGKLIDKAPKLFAARLGGIMSLLIIIAHMAGFPYIAAGVSVIITVLATAECVFNFCLGCYIYSWLVLPFYSRSGA